MNQIPYTKEQLFRANVKLMEQIVRNFRKRIGGIRTRREKLEVIKEKYQAKRLNGRTSVLSVNPTELDWLIKQAERVQELENQNERYREALEFYGDEKVWTRYNQQGNTEISLDGGNKARKALEAEK